MRLLQLVIKNTKEISEKYNKHKQQVDVCLDETYKKCYSNNVCSWTQDKLFSIMLCKVAAREKLLAHNYECLSLPLSPCQMC